MKEIINEVIEELKRELEELYAEGPTLDKVEKYTFSKMKEKAVRLTEVYIGELNKAIRQDKAGRKAAGMVIERRDDKRTVLSRIGEIQYERDYYKKKDGTYEYPADRILEIRRYQRLSDETMTGLAKEAIKHAYADASEIITEGQVSRQTVMNAVRACEAVPTQEKEPLKKAASLHIDADEDHVKLQTGKTRIVPLICVYEGLEKVGKGESSRRRCKNIFYYSEAKFHEDFWDKVVIEIRKRYDISNTRIYLHGDGAAWIKEGLEHFKDCIYVLDSYHRNKAEKGLFAGIGALEGVQERKDLHKAFIEGDEELLKDVCRRRIEESPEEAEKIRSAGNYLINNLRGIKIRYTDPEARNGGATEPHVSHILSSRLSGRPIGWSDGTLKTLVPMLAAGALQIKERTGTDEEDYENEVLSAAQTLLRIKLKSPSRMPALVDPDKCVASPIIESGKITPLFEVIHNFSW